ncbi:DUF2254 domain-containing protein [Falsiroseomonas sp. HW251]|uniref:DUF2254 domain-containing protein n=1 Tax=Falsiroseomonas sp. HW251 TaxID=3390998 RepID=UPI003D3150AE
MPSWMLPLAYTVASIVLAFVVPRIEHRFFPDLSIGLSDSSAVAVLSAAASGVMGLTAIVFSVAFVLVQFSAVAYSPRIALRFSRDPMTFHALGIFFATFMYALATIAWTDRDGGSGVPVLSWFIAMFLLFASLLFFALLVRRLNDLQITAMLRDIGDSGRAVISAMFAAPHGPAVRPERPAAPVVQALRHEGAPRYVERLDIAALVELARHAEAVIVMACAVGDTVADGKAILRQHGGAPIEPRALRAAVKLGLDRTYEQDPKYPIRLLVDIAIKALSPAINDPTTAVQALDQIEDLLRRLARVDLDAGAEADADGRLRLVYPMPSWDDYLSLAFDEIRVFGATSVQVLRRMRAALRGVEEALGEDDPRARQVRAYLAHLDGMIGSSLFDELDRRRAGQEDPQGLGLTRRDEG